jgi:hypothetical protein
MRQGLHGSGLSMLISHVLLYAEYGFLEEFSRFSEIN